MQENELRLSIDLKSERRALNLSARPPIIMIPVIGSQINKCKTEVGDQIVKHKSLSQETYNRNSVLTILLILNRWVLFSLVYFEIGKLRLFLYI